jgi:SpoVK/Ycf46/Vps4 family AAA+-type ATPase
LAEIVLPTDLKSKLEIITDREKMQGEGIIFYFQGPSGLGKERTAQAIAKKLGMGILSVEGESVADSKEVDFDETVCLILREASLQGAILFWLGFDALLTEDKRVLLNRLLSRLEDRKGMTVLAGTTLWEPESALQNRPFLRVEFPIPDYDQRLALWNHVLGDHTHLFPDGTIGEIANKFGLNGSQIRDAAATARNLACWRDPENGKLSWDDLNTACRLQSNRILGTLAKKITPLFKWTDLILPSDQLKQLQEICNHLKYRYVVYRQWGFEQKLSLGKGITVLFSGVPGTGKTMAAEILAREMGLDLYKIDLSSVVSKYIGETEKNLSRIFTEAETSNAILFFDEADALFGKRSEVKDAHDRYANIEIGYLLQKMEEYEGLTILATNLRQNMDEAFVRRMRFIVNFPFPDELHRYKIWNVHFPEKARCGTIDFEFLARQFKLAGGNIRNVVINAAFLAASNDIAISMEHLIHATKREFQKVGKACVKSDFGKYFEMIEDKVNQ